MKRIKERIRGFLKECITPGTEAHEHYKREDWFTISKSILDFTNSVHIAFSLKKCDPYERLSELLEAFKRDCLSGKDFEQSSEKIIESFKWPKARVGCVYTRLPALTVVPYEEDIESVFEELNKVPAHTFAEMEKDFVDAGVSIPLMCKRPAVGEKVDPIKALETFLLAYESGLYPPVWVIDYMAGIFKDFYKSAGTKSLDRLFGFDKKRRGGPFQKSFEKERDEILCTNVWRLEHLFGVDRRTACRLEAERLRNLKNFNRTPLKFSTHLSWKTLEDRYRKKWAPLLADIYGHLDDAWRKEWVEKNGDEFLSQYPSLKKPLQ